MEHDGMTEEQTSQGVSGMINTDFSLGERHNLIFFILNLSHCSVTGLQTQSFCGVSLGCDVLCVDICPTCST